MKHKLLIISILVLLSCSETSAQTTKQDTEKWYIPDFASLQYAGNVGFASVGVGYKLFNDIMYSEFMYGFVPSGISKAKDIHTLSIKSTFPLITKQFNTYSLSPTAGFAVSYETGNNSFASLPSKYPKGYYFPTAFHATIFVGGKVHHNFEKTGVIKGADFYFEVGSVERYLWYAITSKEVGLNDIFSTAIGFNFYF